MRINPKIYESRYANTGTKYWLVKANLPGAGAYQKKHATQIAAERDRVRLLREHGGGSITANDLRLHEMAQHKLETCLGDARGHTILQAVEFFIEHYRDPSKAPRVELCVGAFFREHVRKLREHSQLEYERALLPFLRRFRGTSVSHFTPSNLTEYVLLKNGGVNLKKCLLGLFSFCSGGSKKVKSRYRWLEANPARLIQVEESEEDHEIVVYSLDEVKNSIALALMLGQGMYWTWCYFTGMRPVETQKFWTLPGYGWNRINLEHRYIIVNREIAKDKRRRKILIRPNLLAWLTYFKSKEELPFPDSMVTHRRNFRAIKLATIAPERRTVRDVIRHTFITYRARAFDRSFSGTAAEAGNSEKIIRDHYFDLLSDQNAIAEYWSLTPATFGLVADVPQTTDSFRPNAEACDASEVVDGKQHT